MARWDSMPAHGYGDDEDSEEENTASGHKAKPRRKSHQRPQGSDQIRQAFSKRKKGLVLKAFQLNSLTDAKVFMFIVNDKGTSWAYATPDFKSSLGQPVLNQMRSLADVPESAKLFTEVITSPNANKNSSSRGSSEQTGTQRTDPTSAEYMPPSTRATTGSLPSRSRSSLSWGSDGQAPGQQGADKLARTASNAANARAMQPTPQSDEHSPTMPKARPPSGSSMACNTRASMAAAAAAAGSGYSYQHPYTQAQPQAAGRGPGMEPPTPCGMYNLLGQPISAQDSPSEVAMSCGGSPSSKLMPPPDAATTGRMLAANAQAAAAAATAAAEAAAGGPVGMEGVQMCKAEPMTGEWPPQQQQAGASWDLQYQQQQFMLAMQQQQQQMYQQQQYMQQQFQQQQQQGNFFMGSTEAGRSASVDIPYSACAGVVAGMPWGSLPSGVGAGLLASAAMDTQALNMQQQQCPNPDAFEAMQRGLAPLRLSKPFGGAGSDPDGSRSAPAAAAGMNSVMGPPSQWVHFPDSANEGAADADGSMGNMRAASDAGVYGLGGSQVCSSYAPSPSSCTQHGTSGNGSTPATGVGMPNAAQALLMARGGRSVSQSPSPTAALGQRMTHLAMCSPAGSPLHPSVMGEQQAQAQQQYMQQQGGWGPGPMPPPGAQDSVYQPQQQQQQHNQGAYMPQTDDLVSDPIVEMLMDKPLNQLAHDQHASSTADGHHHLSIMEATLQQQQQQEACRTDSTSADPAAAAAGNASPAWEAPDQGAPAASGPANVVGSLLSAIPPPPKTDAPADKAAWQAEVRRILCTLQPQQRQELAKLSEQQWLMAQGGSGAPCSGPPRVAPAPTASAAGGSGPASNGYGRAFGGKQRLGPSRLSASSPAVDLTPASAAEADAGTAWLGEGAVGLSAPLAAPPGGMLPVLPHQQLQAGSTFFLGSDASKLSSSGMQAQNAACSSGMGYFAPPNGMCSQAMNASACMMPSGSCAVTCDALAGFSGGMPAVSGPSSCSGQMLPLPLAAQVPSVAPEPALAGSSSSNSPFAGSTQQGPNGGAAFVQVAAAVRAGTLLSELRGVAGSPCASPLKRSQPSSGPFGDPEDGTASPLKRPCPARACSEQQPGQNGMQMPPQSLPEPPSFATLLRTEASGEEDAIAWAVAAGDNMKKAGGSCVSLGMPAPMGSLDSFPSAFLRLGSMQGGDSMQLLSALADVTEGGEAGLGVLGEAQAAAAEETTAAEQAS